MAKLDNKKIGEILEKARRLRLKLTPDGAVSNAVNEICGEDGSSRQAYFATALRMLLKEEKDAKTEQMIRDAERVARSRRDDLLDDDGSEFTEDDEKKLPGFGIR